MKKIIERSDILTIFHLEFCYHENIQEAESKMLQYLLLLFKIILKNMNPTTYQNHPGNRIGHDNCRKLYR